MLQDEELLGIYAIELMQMTHQVDKIHISGNLSNTRTMLMEYFVIPVSNFTVFQPRIQTVFDSLELGNSGFLMTN